MAYISASITRIINSLKYIVLGAVIFGLGVYVPLSEGIVEIGAYLSILGGLYFFINLAIYFFEKRREKKTGNKHYGNNSRLANKILWTFLFFIIIFGFLRFVISGWSSWDWYHRTGLLFFMIFWGALGLWIYDKLNEKK